MKLKFQGEYLTDNGTRVTITDHIGSQDAPFRGDCVNPCGSTFRAQFDIHGVAHGINRLNCGNIVTEVQKPTTAAEFIKLENGKYYRTECGSKVKIDTFIVGKAAPFGGWCVAPEPADAKPFYAWFYPYGEFLAASHQKVHGRIVSELTGDEARAPAQDTANTPFAVDMTVPGYEKLADVLQRAYNQAAVGKGKERHAVGEPFHEQVMQLGARKFGTGALLFQAFKKSEESQRLPKDRAVAELLGAINYLSGAVIALEAGDANG
ncbi:hypothetical protein [Curvibacter phage PCA1]|nr:hypothetical protein [Curvibacter phage PCA1]